MEVDPYSTSGLGESAQETTVFDNLLRFLGVVRRRRMIVFYFLAGAICLAIINYKRTPRQYEASASLLVRQTGVGPTVEATESSSALLSTFKQLLLSDRVLIGTVENLEVRPPEFSGTSEPSKWPAVLRQMLKVSFSGSDNIVRVSCRSKDPEATVRVIRALTKASSQFMDDYQRNLSVELVERLDGERQELESRLFDREEELLAARKACGDISLAEGSEQTHPVVDRVNQLSATLTEIRRRRLELEATLASVSQLVRSNSDLSQAMKKMESIVGSSVVARIPGSGFASAEAVRDLESEVSQMTADLENLQRHYGSGHVEIQRRQSLLTMRQQELEDAQQDLDRQVSVGLRDPKIGQWMLNTIQSELTSVRQYETALMTEYSTAEEQALALSDMLADIRVAEREVETLRQLHTSHLNRLNAITIEQGGGTVQFAALTEPMTPGTPVYPILSSMIFIFCFNAVALSLGIIYVVDRLDDRLRTPEEIQSQLGLPLLGVIRKMPEAELSDLRIHCFDHPQTAQSECFRTLKTSVTLSSSPTGCLGVTSSEAGEGKTTTLINLGAAYAQTGRRTLVIDADMRRPGLSKMFRLRGRPGLSEVLMANSGISEMCEARVVRTVVPGLEVLPCGPHIQNAAMLLSMPSLAAILDWAASHYDQVLVDCPPTLPVSDAAIVGRSVDGMLFLLNGAKANRRGVQRAVDRLRGMSVPIVGVVANVTDHRDNLEYEYGYNGDYAHDEHHEDVDDADLDSPVLPFSVEPTEERKMAA